MADRYVTSTTKDPEGDILALCNQGTTWSPRWKTEAIADIESGAHRYFVSWLNGPTTEVHVVNTQTGKYLRTDRDSTPRNNLDDLPDC